MDASCPARADNSSTGTAAVRGSVRSAATRAESVQPWHHHVADDQVGHVGADRLQGLLAVGDGVDLVAGAAQQADQVLAHVGVVVGDEDTRRGVAARDRRTWHCRESAPTRRPPRVWVRYRRESSAEPPARTARPHRKPPRVPPVGATASAGRCAEPNGRRIVNVVPAPSALSAVMLPPCRLTSSLHQGQADTAALVGPRPRGLDAVEPFEQPRHLVGGHTDSGVGRR